jgi:hypothetical protein
MKESVPIHLLPSYGVCNGGKHCADCRGKDLFTHKNAGNKTFGWSSCFGEVRGKWPTWLVELYCTAQKLANDLRRSLHREKRKVPLIEVFYPIKSASHYNILEESFLNSKRPRRFLSHVFPTLRWWAKGGLIHFHFLCTIYFFHSSSLYSSMIRTKMSSTMKQCYSNIKAWCQLHVN